MVHIPLVDLIALCCATAASAWAGARAVRLARLRSSARRNVAASGQARSILGGALGGLTGEPIGAAELGAYAAATAAEFTWHLATIDPELIHAAAFSSAEPIHDGLQYAEYICQHLSNGGGEAFLNRLAGYVGEQRVADLLIHGGHAVQFAATANQPVWDLLVDGHAVNVKTISDIASVKAEALGHTGVTYIVPDDAAGHAGGNIQHLHHFNHDAIKESIKDSVATAHGESALHGMFHHLPWITVAFAIHRNVKGVQLGKDPLVAVGHAVVESAARGSGLLAGAAAGGAAGSVLGPLGAVAGALIGGMLGAMGGAALAEAMKQAPLRRAHQDLGRALAAFGASFAGDLDRIRGFLRRPHERMAEAYADLSRTVCARKRSLRWLLWPDFQTVLLDEAAGEGWKRVQAEQTRLADFEQVLQEACSSGNYQGVGLIMANSPVVRLAIGYREELLNHVVTARTRVIYHRKQLNPAYQAPA